MDGIILPDFLNTEEKYNKLINEVNSLHKFEQIFLKLLSDNTLELPTILSLMKVIERDVILMNKLTEVSALMEMTESFLRYMLMKELISPEQQQQNPKSIKKLSKDTPKKTKKLPKEDSKKLDLQLYVNLTINILNLK